MLNKLALALSRSSREVLRNYGASQVADLLTEKPATLVAEMLRELDAAYPDGYDPDAVRQSVRDNAYVLLPSAFNLGELPNTPEGFRPVPVCATTLHAQLAALGAQAVLDKEPISYGSENDGVLFVNLTAMPGENRFAEKSKSRMRGHTDAVSFPFPGTKDPTNTRIAPSPNLVTLIGLRNPKAVATHLMPLHRVLSNLSAEDMAQLLDPQFYIQCQETFREGSKRVLGKFHSAWEVAVLLKRAGSEYWIRFSHQMVVASDPENIKAGRACEHLAEACRKAIVPVMVTPGSILLINNRTALHGRDEVGQDVGGDSRWLLRTYGLGSTSIAAESRYPAHPHILFP